jgi:hypothetical protein
VVNVEAFAPFTEVGVCVVVEAVTTAHDAPFVELETNCVSIKRDITTA